MATLDGSALSKSAWRETEDYHERGVNLKRVLIVAAAFAAIIVLFVLPLPREASDDPAQGQVSYAGHPDKKRSD